MIVMSSLIRIFVYIFFMSKDASLRFGPYEISLRSFIRWVVFFTLNVYVKGM